MPRAMMCGLLLLSAPAAQAEAPPVPIHETGLHVGVDVEPSNAEESGPNLRPLDESDPEMKQLTEAFFDLTPCGGTLHGMCDEASQLLVGGSDRLARYLIQQIERNEAEGFPDRGTYLHLLGHTQSDVAFAYLADLLESRRAAYARGEVYPHVYRVAIESLGNTRQMDVIEKAMPILEAETDPGFQIAAVNALDRVQGKHGPIPAVESGLRVLKQRNAGRGYWDPWQQVQQRIDAVLANPGHPKP